MKLGLSWLTQLRGTPPSDPTPGTNANGTPHDLTADDSGQRNTTGGWAALSFQQLVAAIAVGYGQQHNDDDTHSTITATGPISERGRTTPMGVWIKVPWATSNFMAATGSTWTVTATQQKAFQYMLVGTTMFVNFYIESSPLATAPAAAIYLTIPGFAFATLQQFAACSYDDNGTLGTGVIQVLPSATATRIGIYKDLRGTSTWSVSAALSVVGQIAFEVGGTI